MQILSALPLPFLCLISCSENRRSSFFFQQLHGCVALTGPQALDQPGSSDQLCAHHAHDLYTGIGSPVSGASSTNAPIIIFPAS